MPISEFMIIAAIVIVGLIFLVVAQKFIFSSSEQTKEYQYREEGQSLVSLLDRLSTETANYASYKQYINFCNITVDNGVLTYERNGIKNSFQVSKEVNDVYLKDISSICVSKNENGITIASDCTCNYDGLCTPAECKEPCEDCRGPRSQCIGDDFCNKNILENCQNSIDCKCESGVCCPGSPDSDGRGCTSGENALKKKGEECWCDVQCESGLKCNPTTSTFKNYNKACCEEGKNWNGTDCIVPECGYPCEPGCIIPKSFDWRNYKGKNWLNPIRNQGRCGSCWTFSAVGTVEGTYNVEQNTPAANKDLAEQDLLSCSGQGTCEGGLPWKALGYVKSSGACDESCFPYAAADISCSRCSDVNSRLWKITNYGYVSGNDNIKRALICDGPLSVSSMNWGHAITLVGYDDNKQTWIIRNSWGLLNGWRSNPPGDPAIYYENGYGYVPYSGHKYSDIADNVYYSEGVTSP